MKRVLVPFWNMRISPVFDAARSVFILDIGDMTVRSRSVVELAPEDPLERARQIVMLGVDTVICGAISRPHSAALHAMGVRILSGICGPVEEVVSAFIHRTLNEDHFRMPGETAGRNRCRSRHGRGGGRRHGGRWKGGG